MKRSQLVEVTRVADPTREDFESTYVRPGRPVIVEGVASRWPAAGRWSLDYLCGVAGERFVSVQHYPNGNRFQFLNHRTVSMRLREYVELVEEEPNRRFWYLAEQPIASVVPEVAGEVLLPAIVAPDAVQSAVLFAGWDTFSQFHYHAFTHSLLAQVMGTKTVRLFDPSQTRRLYPNSWRSPAANFSRMEEFRSGDRRFPRFSSARGLECTLKAGEMLFIPLHWWHDVIGVGESLSVTTSWKAPLAHWHFPTPGMRILGGLAWRRIHRE